MTRRRRQEHEQLHERKLPPNWRKVPSTSRKGEYSYVHLPTGFKQADFPLTDEPSAEHLEAARTAAAQLKDATPKNTAAAAALAARRAAAAARWGAFPKDSAPLYSFRSCSSSQAGGCADLPASTRQLEARAVAVASRRVQLLARAHWLQADGRTHERASRSRDVQAMAEGDGEPEHQTASDR